MCLLINVEVSLCQFIAIGKHLLLPNMNGDKTFWVFRLALAKRIISTHRPEERVAV